jgi:hypothetical protein
MEEEVVILYVCFFVNHKKGKGVNTIKKENEMDKCDLLFQLPILLQNVNKALSGEKYSMLKISKGFCRTFKENIEKGVVVLLSGKKILDVFLVDNVTEFMERAKSFGGLKAMYIVIYDLEIEKAYKLVFEYLKLILIEKTDS